MKIAIYHNLASGGAKRALYEATRRLVANHQIDVFTTNGADHAFCDIRPFANHIVYEFVPHQLYKSPIGRLNQLQRWRDVWRLDRLARIVAERIDAQGYDVVFAQPCIWTQAPYALRYLRTPSVYYCHEPPRALYEDKGYSAALGKGWRSIVDQVDPLIRLYRSTAQRMDREATRAASLVLVNSKFSQNQIARIYEIAPILSYPGVDTNAFRPLSECMRENFVLSVGAIHPHKGFEFVIQALGSIPAEIRPPLKLIGNHALEDERRFLEKTAKDSMVNMEIEVGVDQDQLIRRYNQARLFVYAPINEPLGLAPLEAMACGTPVIAVNEGGVCETVKDGITGWLVERDVTRFAKATEYLLSNPDQWAIYGAQARKDVLNNWTWDAAAKHMEQMLIAASTHERQVKVVS